ncbi:unnamed protein product [Durusdinium trenchii]|uniref:Uncharacterized protein n=1 Tax=Durusdinium trenchii TaxID=1381693 RepID=A0ABP0HS27_9DINO
MSLNYGSLDPTSARAQKERNLQRKEFLRRHGFAEEDITSSRDSQGYQKVRMEPLSPIEVAEQTGQQGIINLLVAAGAKRPGSPTSSCSPFQLLRRFTSSSRSSRSSGSSSSSGTSSTEVVTLAASAQGAFVLRSCLSKRKEEERRSEWV